MEFQWRDTLPADAVPFKFMGIVYERWYIQPNGMTWEKIHKDQKGTQVGYLSGTSTNIPNAKILKHTVVLKDYSTMNIRTRRFPHALAMLYSFDMMPKHFIRVKFRDGNQENCALENLEVVTMETVQRDYQNFGWMNPDGSVQEEWRPIPFSRNECIIYGLLPNQNEVSNTGIIRNQTGKIFRPKYARDYMKIYISSDVLMPGIDFFFAQRGGGGYASA